MNPSSRGRSHRTPFVALSALLLMLPNGCGTTIYGRPSDETHTAAGAAAGTASGGTIGLIAGVAASAIPAGLLIGTAAGAGIGAGYGFTQDEQRHELEFSREMMREQDQKIKQQQKEIEKLKRSLSDRASLKRPSADVQPIPMMTASYIKENYNGSKRAKPLSSDAVNVPVRVIKAPAQTTRRSIPTSGAQPLQGQPSQTVRSQPMSSQTPQGQLPNAQVANAQVANAQGVHGQGARYRGREWLSAPSSKTRSVSESSATATAVQPAHGVLMPPANTGATTIEPATTGTARPPRAELITAPKSPATSVTATAPGGIPAANRLEPARKTPITESSLITDGGGNDDEMALGEEIEDDEADSKAEDTELVEAKAAVKKTRSEPVEAESFILDEEATSSAKTPKEQKIDVAKASDPSKTSSFKRPSNKECTQAAAEAQRANTAQAPADQLFYLRRALRLCPADPTYHVEIGKVFTKLGKTDDAKYEFRQAIDLDPANETAREQLSKLEGSER